MAKVVEMIKIQFTRSLFPYKKWQIVDFKLSKYSDLVRKCSQEVIEDEIIDDNTIKLTKKEIIVKILEISKEKELNIDEVQKEIRTFNKWMLIIHLEELEKEDEIIDDLNDEKEDNEEVIEEDKKTSENDEKTIENKENKAILDNKNTK